MGDLTEEFKVNGDALCPEGWGHRWVQVYLSSEVEILKCVKCQKDSVGYFGNPWKHFGGSLEAARRKA